MSVPARAEASASSSDNLSTAGRIWGVVRRPRSTFEAIVRSPRWAGLVVLLFVVYFGVSAGLFSTRVGQQALVTKLEYSHDAAPAVSGVREAEATPKEPKSKAKPGDALKPTGDPKSKPKATGGGKGPSGNGAAGARPPANGARRSGTPAGSGARSRNRKRKRK